MFDFDVVGFTQY